MQRNVAVLFLFAALAAAGPGEAQDLVRAQLDTVGFATNRIDFAKVVYAANTAEGLNAPNVRRRADPALAVILPHDDYLYAGRTAVHALPHLRAKRWIVFGVCHACRRMGLRDRVLLDGFSAWRVAGQEFPVDNGLRSLLADRLGDLAEVSSERHAKEHSLEAMLPWIGAAVGDFTFVPVLVAGMELDRIEALAAKVAGILADHCEENGWVLGRDLGIMISADAVHYGCEGWGSGGYAPFGCDAAGHAAGRAQDIELAEDTLAGPLTSARIAAFTQQVWDPQHPEYPEYPYRITWCGLYSIPFGLTVVEKLVSRLGLPPLAGKLLRYGDSVSDGRLELDDVRLGVTAPNTLQHWVGYPTLIYQQP